jgi:hypothetical protein
MLTVLQILEDVPISPSELKVEVSASLPDTSLLGIKIFNGKPTKTILTYVSHEDEPVNIHFVGGSLWSDRVDTQNLRNLTGSKYETALAPGESKNVEYTFATEMQPQDVNLIIATILSKQGKYFTIQALNTTVSIVDEATSIFDPQILFLYVVLLAAFLGTGYLIYNTWLAPLFPTKNKRRFNVKSAGIKPGQATATGPTEGVTTGAKTYDESWIPEHHIRKPEIKRSRSGTPAGKTKSRA